MNLLDISVAAQTQQHTLHSLNERGFLDPLKNKKDKQNMEFPEAQAQKVTSNIGYWKPEAVGDAIVGVLVDSFTREEYGTTYILETGEDERTGTPSHGYLQNLLSQVPKGHIVRITFTGLGEAKKGMSAPKLYDVEHATA